MVSALCRVLTAALLLASWPAYARTLEVGPGKPYAQPSEAAAAAKSGDRVVIAAGEYFDCAVWPQSNLVIEGDPGGGTVITDKSCQGKGLFVIPGNDVTVRNLTLTRARVPDGNGAGIRAEGRNLVIEHVRFINNQNGILAHDQPQGSLIVRDSEFLRNGVCEQACAHGIYAGQLGLVRIERSIFRETRQGHHIKSRALRTEIVGCDIADGPEGSASFLVEIPIGGSLLLQSNRMEKGPKSENHRAAVMIGAEGVAQPTREILVEGNEFRADGDYPTTFVYNMTATDAVLRDNRIEGRQVKQLHGDGTVLAGNR
ncbi:MAG: hypothetical protein JOZ58_06175 [Acetobacteraceae bacterium]|nr:hypothetical protein [Acetobacteraceae bacterium]